MACEEMVLVRSEAVDWLKKHYPALCEKSGLCERIGGRLYTRTALPAPTPPAQASGQDDSCLRERITELLDTNRRQQVQIKTLEARIHRQAQDAADAARYRWLRDREIPEVMDLWHQNPDRFDAAIDAAIAAGSPLREGGE